MLFIVFMFCACNTNKQTSDNTPAVSGEMTVYEGKDNNAPLSNPLMGWQCMGNPEDIIRSGVPDEFDIGVIKCSWDKLEPTKNGYDFDLVDKAIARLRKDGKTVFLKLFLMPDDIWGVEGYPAWIRQEDGIGEFKPIYPDVPEHRYRHPDYKSAVWQGLVSKFLKYVASHYPDGAVDVLDSRAYGICGEWDSNWGNYWANYYINSPEYPAIKTATLTKIVDIYIDAFKDYKLTKIAINVSSNGYESVEKARAYLREAAGGSA
jgi:hypothetical protein